MQIGIKTICGLLFFGTLVGRSFAYEEDVHFILTIFLADQAGISEQIAYELAKYDQGTDDDPATEPFFGGGILSFGLTSRAMFHFADVLRLDEMELMSKKCDLKANGQFLHTAGDHFSHAGYSSIFGHLTGGHRPDIPRNAANYAARMANSLLIGLFLHREHCPTWFSRDVEFNGHMLKQLRDTRLIPFFTHPDDSITDSKLISLTKEEWEKYKLLWNSYMDWRKSSFGN
jgi:hypothetical protein